MPPSSGSCFNSSFTLNLFSGICYCCVSLFHKGPPQFEYEEMSSFTSLSERLMTQPLFILTIRIDHINVKTKSSGSGNILDKALLSTRVMRWIRKPVCSFIGKPLEIKVEIKERGWSRKWLRLREETYSQCRWCVQNERYKDNDFYQPCWYKCLFPFV